MSCSILNFDASQENILSTKGEFELCSVETLIKNLKKSKGSPEKPVRLLINEGNVVVTKFGIGMNRERDACIHDELNNLTEIEKSQLSTPHIVKLVWGFKDKKNCILCTEYLRPLKQGVHTLRDLVKTGCDDAVWRQCLFQIIYTLLCLHCEFPGFRHNDLKADNILVTNPTKNASSYAVDATQSNLPEPLKIRRTYFLSPVVAWTKIIDLEISTEPNSEKRRLKSRVTKNSSQLLFDYGVSEAHCALFDLHLLSFDILDNFPESKTKQEFYSFITQFIPSKLFLKENLTSKYRMKLEHQRDLQTGTKKDVLLDMLSHSYFYFLRGEHHEVTEFEIKYKSPSS